MKRQSLFLEKNKKNVNLWFAEEAQSMVMVKKTGLFYKRYFFFFTCLIFYTQSLI